MDLLAYNEKLLKDLDQGFKEIFQSEQSLRNDRYMELSAHVYNYITENNIVQNPYNDIQLIGSELYEHINEFIKGYVSDLLKTFNDIKDDETLLNQYGKNWILYKSSSTVLNNICWYLNKYFVSNERKDGKEKIYEIHRLALINWKEKIFGELSERITNAVLKSIDEDRSGKNINCSLVRDIINCYVELGFDDEDDKKYAIYGQNKKMAVYQQHFEKKFLAETEAFYKQESESFLSSNTISEYIKRVEKRLDEEQKRANNSSFMSYLPDITLEKLINTCEKVLIEKYFNEFCAEFQSLLNDDKILDLKRVYTLVARNPCHLTKFNTILEQHIINQGSQAIDKCCSDESIDHPKIHVENILKVYKKYNNLILSAFNNNCGFVSALDKACNTFINSNSLSSNASKSTELLAKYCHTLLKKSPKDPEEKELENNLDQAIVVFKYIEDKDVFQKLYSNMLATRLINHASASDDAETLMISKLKEMCGYDYISKFERMFQDIRISKDLSNNYKQHLQSKNIPMEIDFSTKVLTFGSWPYKQSSSLSLPSELEQVVQDFNTFYNSNHSGRKLNCMYQMCNGELVTNCFGQKYTLQANIFQMAVLMQFNDQNSYSIKQLQENTQIKEDILIQVLQTLLKPQLLTCTDDANSLTSDSVMELYRDFKNKKLRINIKQPLKTEVKVEQENVHRNIEGERKILIETAIVKIMKRRRILTHNELITEVINDLSPRFKPELPMIKKCISKLIEKEYIERVEGEDLTYKYLP